MRRRRSEDIYQPGTTVDIMDDHVRLNNVGVLPLASSTTDTARYQPASPAATGTPLRPRRQSRCGHH